MRRGGALLICPGPPVAGRGTTRASSQSLPLFEDGLNPLPEREGNADMCMCVTVFMCACTSWVDHSGAASQGLSSPSVFDDAAMHYFLHNAPIMGHCPLAVASELPRGGVTRPEPGLQRLAKGELQKRTRCHTLALLSFHLCPSNDCVPVFGRKMGLCGAQRFQSPKAARQIRPLRSAMARIDRIPSSSFKLHFP